MESFLPASREQHVERLVRLASENAFAALNNCNRMFQAVHEGGDLFTAFIGQQLQHVAQYASILRVNKKMLPTTSLGAAEFCCHQSLLTYQEAVVLTWCDLSRDLLCGPGIRGELMLRMSKWAVGNWLLRLAADEADIRHVVAVRLGSDAVKYQEQSDRARSGIRREAAVLLRDVADFARGNEVDGFETRYLLFLAEDTRQAIERVLTVFRQLAAAEDPAICSRVWSTVRPWVNPWIDSATNYAVELSGASREYLDRLNRTSFPSLAKLVAARKGVADSWIASVNGAANVAFGDSMTPREAREWLRRLGCTRSGMTELDWPAHEIEQAAADGGQVLGPPISEVVSFDPPQIAVDGVIYALSHDAAMYLHELVSCGEWMSDPEYMKRNPIVGENFRFDRLSLPDEVRKKIETDRRKGKKWIG